MADTVQTSRLERPMNAMFAQSKQAVAFLDALDSYTRQERKELSIPVFTKAIANELVVALITKLQIAQFQIVVPPMQHKQQSKPRASMSARERRLEKFKEAYHANRNGRRQRATVLLAMKAAGVSETTAWKYVAALGLQESGK